MSKVTPCEGCGARCMYEDPDPATDEPCYGELRPISAEEYEGNGYVDTFFKHACEGHKRAGYYVPEDEADCDN